MAIHGRTREQGFHGGVNVEVETGPLRSHQLHRSGPGPAVAVPGEGQQEAGRQGASLSSELAVGGPAQIGEAVETEGTLSIHRTQLDRRPDRRL